MIDVRELSLEDRFALIEREAEKSKVMIEMIQGNYDFDSAGTFLTQDQAHKVACEKRYILQMLVTVFDSMCEIIDLRDSVDFIGNVPAGAATSTGTEEK